MYDPDAIEQAELERISLEKERREYMDKVAIAYISSKPPELLQDFKLVAACAYRLAEDMWAEKRLHNTNKKS